MVTAGAVAALACASGCEDADTGSSLSIDPASTDLTGSGATVVLTAQADTGLSVSNRSSQLILPLTWSVSNPALGRILSSRGYIAVYESNGKVGQNVVFCEDAYGREGLAVINQDDEPETP